MFRFSLQVALDARERQEKIKMKELAEALSAEQGIIGQINQVHENTKRADQELNRTKKMKQLSIEHMKYLSQFKQRMKVVLTDYHQKLEVAKKRVAERQHALLEASKKRKTLEILKEKEYRKFTEKITRIERKNMDEIAGNMFIQNRLRN